jgi:hypothetical protein
MTTVDDVQDAYPKLRDVPEKCCLVARWMSETLARLPF